MSKKENHCECEHFYCDIIPLMILKTNLKIQKELSQFVNKYSQNICRKFCKISEPFFPRNLGAIFMPNAGKECVIYWKMNVFIERTVKQNSKKNLSQV